MCGGQATTAVPHIRPASRSRQRYCALTKLATERLRRLKSWSPSALLFQFYFSLVAMYVTPHVQYSIKSAATTRCLSILSSPHPRYVKNLKPFCFEVPYCLLRHQIFCASVFRCRRPVCPAGPFWFASVRYCK